MKTPEKSKQAEPICKFGPGGDFIATWQPGSSESPEVSNCLTKLLISIVEALAVVIGLKRICSNAPLINAFYSDELIGCHEEEVINVFCNRKNKYDSTSNATIEDDSSFSGEPLLFPNFSRDGNRIEHKSKHNIRTYRRTAKKRSALRSSEQGSLFEIKFQGVQSA